MVLICFYELLCSISTQGLCVFYRWRLVCRGSALISHGPSFATSDATSIKTLCTMSRCLQQLVVSLGRMLPRQLWWPKPFSQSWTVRVHWTVSFLLSPISKPPFLFFLTTSSRCFHTVVHVERHAVWVFAEPQHSPAAWIHPGPRGHLRQAPHTFPGGA